MYAIRSYYERGDLDRGLQLGDRRIVAGFEPIGQASRVGMR